MTSKIIQKKTRLKICGITKPEDIYLLDNLGVDYAGLWCGIPHGVYNLDLSNFIHLSRIPTRNLKIVLVTFAQSIRFCAPFVENCRISAIQLHGFQLPSIVKQFKTTFGSGIKIIKVMHVKGNDCAEETVIKRYLDAGTDIILLDSMENNNRIGSTAICIEAAFLDKFMSAHVKADRVMIAGGINESNIGSLCKRYHPFAFDVDSAVRYKNLICETQVKRIIAKLRLQEPRKRNNTKEDEIRNKTYR